MKGFKLVEWQWYWPGIFHFPWRYMWSATEEGPVELWCGASCLQLRYIKECTH